MIRLGFWQFPLSLITAIAFAVALIYVHQRFAGSKAVKLLASWKCAMLLSCLAALQCAIEGIWGIPLHYTPVFIITALLTMSSLGLGLLEMKTAKKSFKLSHLGFFLVIFAGFFGAPDLTKAELKLYPQKSENICVEKDGTLVPLCFDVKMTDFVIDYYEDGTSPKQFTSFLEIDGKGMKTSVNSPCHYKGYNFYQSGYDTVDGEYSVLLVTKDFWWPLVLLGLALLACGAVMSLGGQWKLKILLPVCLALAALFSVISVARISFGTLMPALRSLWFIPHLLIYMIAYSLLAIAIVIGMVGIAGKKTAMDELARKLLNTCSALLFVGMCCGAIWAKQAWGDWWTWDPKECWAGATWLLTLAGMHSFESPEKKKKTVFIFILLAFLAMQVTWYGVNYLPSAENSIHAYTNN